MAITAEWLESSLKENGSEHNIGRILKVSEEAATGSNENFTSVVKRLKVETLNHEGEVQTISLIVKVAPLEGKVLDFLKDEAFMETEIKAYKSVLPIFEKILLELHKPTLWADFLLEKERYIIFSDLTSEGFISICRKKRMDMEHAKQVIKGLALFHAVSLAAIKSGKLDIKDLPPCLLTRSSQAIKGYRESAFRVATKTMRDKWGPEWVEIAKLLEDKLFQEELEKLAEVDESRLNVVCHGDPWTSNIFFRYSNSHPIAVKFVDFQLVHYNTYAFDIVYLLATSLPPDLRRNEKTEILECYTEAFAQNLKIFGLSHLAPNLETVRAEVKRLNLYYVSVLLIELPVEISDLEDPLHLGENVCNTEKVGTHNPKLYEGSFKHEVDQDLIQWAKEFNFMSA